jgi:phosphoribosylanthranilate isomerase
LKIKICGLFREQDIEYVNEARPDFCGFVFAPSKRQVSAELAGRLRQRLAGGIVPVGVFVNHSLEEVNFLYRNGIIGIAQLHGDENEEYIAHLKEASGDTPIKVIKVIKYEQLDISKPLMTEADYILIDSGAGSGKPFNWNILNPPHSPFKKPWFLAGGISMDNIEQAMALNPFGIDVSSGAETDGVKDREKILQLTNIVRKGNSL